MVMDGRSGSGQKVQRRGYIFKILLEVIAEAGPQAFLQIYIVGYKNVIDPLSSFSIVTSLFTVSLGMTNAMSSHLVLMQRSDGSAPFADKGTKLTLVLN